jgi:hypothetical protein
VGFPLQSASHSATSLCAALKPFYSGGEVLKKLVNRCAKAKAFVSWFGFMLVIFLIQQRCAQVVMCIGQIGTNGIR